MLIAQAGMVVTLGTLLLVPDLNAEIDLVTVSYTHLRAHET